MKTLCKNIYAELEAIIIVLLSFSKIFCSFLERQGEININVRGKPLLYTPCQGSSLQPEQVLSPGMKPATFGAQNYAQATEPY